MNVEPKDSIRIMPDQLRSLVTSFARKAGMSHERSEFLADLLVMNDLRGVFSHGSQQIATYARIMRDGLIHPNPEVRTVNEAPSTIVVDGDGGLGYFAVYQAVQELVERCRNNGIAAAVTRNHGHIGAAGIYSRLLAEEGLIGYVTSGHQLDLKAEDSIVNAAGGSPMSFAVPSGNEVPMVLDFGATLDIFPDAPHLDQLFKLAPGLIFRNMGLGFMCQALGGFLAGIPVVRNDEGKDYVGANQGALIIALDAGRFIQPDLFKNEMDTYMKITSEMQPMPGYDRATLPGVLESERERNWAVSGIPISREHQSILEAAGKEFGVDLPF
ncbi:Ldh family oxidoreductase [Paenibacillus sp. GCM10028914]|uniref:Ldh family oxidoreductase n=1 Tax=Paenibacillus sp. GCM10028914 TaxID=3273416 RepID=UPI0036120485